MKLLLPTIDFSRREGATASKERLAPRLATLDDKVIGYADGWAHRRSDGSFTMYPLMEEIHRFLSERFQVAPHKWLHKPNISHPLTDEEVDSFLEGVDAVVNGECA